MGLSRRLDRSGDEQSLIVHSYQAVLTHILTLGSTEAPPGSLLSQTQCPSSEPSSDLARSSPDTGCSSGSWTWPVGIVGYSWTPLSSSILLLCGKVSCIWTHVYLLGIDVQRLRPRYLYGQSAGSIGHSFPLTPALSTPGLTVTVTLIVIVGIIWRNPTLMTSLQFLLNQMLPTILALSWPSQNTWDSGFPQHPDMCLHLDLSASVLDWSTTWIETPFLSPRLIWKLCSSYCGTGSTNQQLRRRSLPPSPVNYLMLVMYSLQAGFSSTGFWLQKEKLLDVLRCTEASLYTWRRPSETICTGGSKLCSLGTVFPFWYMILRRISRWMPAPRGGGEISPASGLIITNSTSIFLYVLLHTCTTCISPISSYWLTSSSPACGDRSCVTST